MIGARYEVVATKMTNFGEEVGVRSADWASVSSVELAVSYLSIYIAQVLLILRDSLRSSGRFQAL
jgi:hypothetical protein